MLEHLILNGRIQAAHCYHEIAPRGFREELLAHFKQGKRRDFIRLFALLKNEDKLQFYLRVYFLIYNIHPSLKAKATIPEEEVTAFREYLDTRGADLAKTNQFLEFYALSFVKKPLEHPSYKVLFKKEWVSNLTDKLNSFLLNEQVRMREVVDRHQSQNKAMRSPQFMQPNQVPAASSALRSVQQKNQRLFEQVQTFRQRYHQLQRNNQIMIDSFNHHLMQSQQKWFQLTRELTNNSKILVEMIGKSNSGLVHERKYQKIKKRTQKFEKIVKKELDQLLNQSQDLSVFDRPSNNEISYSATATPNVSQRNITTVLTIDELLPINYLALIKDFKRMPDTQKIAVLQGLSWRILKAKTKSIRRQTIIGLVVNDVLGLVNGDIQILLFTPVLTIHVVRLFLFISQDGYGRRVLFGNGALYKQLIDLISQILRSQDYPCLELILQILLNIWHNRQIFSQLINLNIIDIYLNVLLQNEHVVCHEGLVESIMTMLLNATATDEGLQSFEYQVDVFFYLCQVFKVANDTNRNLIGAIIYSLLGRRNLWKLAHEAKLPHFIEDLIQIDERSNKQQLKLIQAKLHAFEVGKTMGADEFEDQESEEEDLEEEHYEINEDELIDCEDYVKGHEMLAAKYPLKNREAEKQLQEINVIMAQNRRSRDGQEFPEARTDGKTEERRKQQQEKLAQVRLPEIKRKKESVEIYNPKPKVKTAESKEYYSFKSPVEKKSLASIQAQSFDHFREGSLDKNDKKKGIENQQPAGQKRLNRVQTAKASEPIRDKDSLKKEDKRKHEKKSSEKHEYRIKKSTSAEKGGNIYRKELAFESNKYISNVAEFKPLEGVKSPTQRRTRDEVLKQLNQELRAEKKAEEQERHDKKVESKYISAQESAHRENMHFKKNYVPPAEESQAFSSKPKIRRTPPKDDE